MDTGFSGGILIPFSLYLKLGFTLFEVPSKYYGVLPKVFKYLFIQH